MAFYPIARDIQGLNLPGIMQAQQNYRLGEAKLAKYGREAKREEKMTGLRAGAIAGDRSMLDEIASFDPEAAAEIVKYRDTVSESEREKFMRDARIVTQAVEGLGENPSSMQIQGLLSQLSENGISEKSFPFLRDEDIANVASQPERLQRIMPQIAAAVEQMQKRARGMEAEPRETRERKEGDKILTEEYDPISGKWGPLSEAPRSTRAKDTAKWSEPRFDKGVGKWYQENMETGKRDYESVPTGMEITAGGATVRTGVPMQKKTAASLEDKVISATNGLARVRSIKSSFRPEYQTVATRWDALKTAFQEKAAGIPALEWVGKQFGEGDRQLLRDFTVYKRRSIENLNLYIKEITGAQMSIQEAQRLTRGMPNPGKGLLDGDSPTEFYAKLIDVERSLKKATARYVYALKNGLDPLAMNIDEIENVMSRRWGDVYNSLPKDMDEVMRQAEADKRVAEEFGLGL